MLVVCALALPVRGRLETNLMVFPLPPDVPFEHEATRMLAQAAEADRMIVDKREDLIAVFSTQNNRETRPCQPVFSLAPHEKLRRGSRRDALAVPCNMPHRSSLARVGQLPPPIWL
jgi:hypothetical protein